ncbi:MAG: DUF1801 domain-containing protein [Acidobacteria bacterium]|nr:DUF1801 domain-containing protein [Acidobacteriota bacterium]
MRTDRTVPENIDEYVANSPGDVRAKLERMRATIRRAAPGSEEKISYGIPAFAKDGIVLYFAAYANRISIYPAPRGDAQFKNELAKYKGGKGTIQFPLDKPIPYDLIERIAKFRVEGNRNKAERKIKKK